ncbi:hypothetical protein [Alcaligenes sp. Marseille-Q7550]
MKKTDFPQRTPLVRRQMLKRTPFKSKPKVKKGPSLGQRIAQLLGTALQHRPKPQGVYRSERHRRNVAALPCANCGRWGRSQAAHMNGVEFGKGLGLKVSDALMFPLCVDEVGVRGCHSLLDQGGIYDKGTAIGFQITWLHQTRDELKRLGQWPEEADRDVEKFVGAYLRRQVA